MIVQSLIVPMFLSAFLSVGTAVSQDEARTPFEIIEHRVALHLFPSIHGISCDDTIRVRRVGKGDRLSFRFSPIYKVEKATIKGRKVEVKRTRDRLEIEEIPKDSVFDVMLSYTGVMSFRTEYSILAKDRAILREEELLPYTTRSLQFVRMSITVPKEWKVIAPGRLIAQDTVRDSLQTIWQIEQPVPLIGWICAGKFSDQSHIQGVTPIGLHLTEADSAGAAQLLPLASDVLRFYSERFAPYPFSKLSIVEVDDWVAGRNVLALAMPSVILMKRQTFTSDDRFTRAEAILPHEIAHQWWPMTVAVEDEDIAVLAEGLCEYSALLYNEAKGALSARDSLGHHPLLRSLILRVQKGKDLPLQKKADLRSLPTHYLKAAYVHNMLRRIIGDSVYFSLLHQLPKRFAGTRIDLADFQQVAEELSGKKLDWFVRQWIQNRGLPRLKLYRVKSTSEGNYWLTSGRVRIVGYDKYTTFVEVGAETPRGIEKVVVWLGTNEAGTYVNDVPFEIRTPEKPFRVHLDPGGDVLKIQKMPVKFSDVRDPSDGLMIVGTTQHAETLLALARADSAELDRSWWSVMIKPDTGVTLADLQGERVFLYGKASENKVVADLEKKFPISFRGDTAIIEGAAVFDSSLALLQCIENPFIAHGFMAWIAPFTPVARPTLLPYDHSWIILRGKDEISSGTWMVKDEDLVVDVK